MALSIENGYVIEHACGAAWSALLFLLFARQVTHKQRTYARGRRRHSRPRSLRLTAALRSS
jgi:hypothetical protein